MVYMMNGEEGTDVAVKTLDTALILHADHGLNASTFTGRVTVSTLSDIYSAATAAVGSLKGPLHGGANEAVMKMLLEIGSPDRAESYVREKLAHKERIMGIGHRVYKNGDPRVKHLKRLSKALNGEKGTYHWVEISERIEKIMQEEKGLLPQRRLLLRLGLLRSGHPTSLYTPIFAASRISGWTATCSSSTGTTGSSGQARRTSARATARSRSSGRMLERMRRGGLRAVPLLLGRQAQPSRRAASSSGSPARSRGRSKRNSRPEEGARDHEANGGGVRVHACA